MHKITIQLQLTGTRFFSATHTNTYSYSGFDA